MSDATTTVEIPASLREELDRWGMGGAGTWRTVSSASHLVYVDEDDGEYTVLTTTYNAVVVVPPGRPLLEVVLDVMVALGARRYDGRACRVCGCTDADCSECIARTGQPCSWIESDLCSACPTLTEARP